LTANHLGREELIPFDPNRRVIDYRVFGGATVVFPADFANLGLPITSQNTFCDEQRSFRSGKYEVEGGNQLHRRMVCGTGFAPGLLWMFGEIPHSTVRLIFFTDDGRKEPNEDDLKEVTLAKSLYPEAVVTLRFAPTPP